MGLNICDNLEINEVLWKTLSTIIDCSEFYSFVPTFDSSFGKLLLNSSKLQLNEVSSYSSSRHMSILPSVALIAFCKIASLAELYGHYLLWSLFPPIRCVLSWQGPIIHIDSGTSHSPLLLKGDKYLRNQITHIRHLWMGIRK